ncbi:HYR domain-containing protein, partial [Salinimicrobium oceani]
AVEDKEAPKISLGNAIAQTTDAGKCTASITIPDASFSDNCSGSTISWILSGATTGSGNGQTGTHVFKLGTTSLTYTVKDAANNIVEGSVDITVTDTELPVITAGADVKVPN